MSIRVGRGIAVLGACVLWVACSKSENQAGAGASTGATTGATTGAATATTPPPPALTDTNIFALLDEANAGDSTLGNLASTKGTNASVKAFGRQMMHDHHMLRKQGQDLAKKLKITPAPPAGDTLQSSAQKMADSLKAQAKGPAWDQAYVSHEVAAHQAVLALLQNAESAAQDTSLKAAITKAQPVIQGHLAKIQDIQTKLGNATAAGGGDTTGKTADTTKKGAKKKL